MSEQINETVAEKVVVVNTNKNVAKPTSPLYDQFKEWYAAKKGIEATAVQANLLTPRQASKFMRETGKR